MRELRRRLLIVLSTFSLLFFVCISIVLIRSSGRKGRIVIGGKNHTEQFILGEMLAILIEEKSGLKVERNLNLDGTVIAFNALKSGDIDLYVEYTGTLDLEILKGKELSEFDIEMFPTMGFDNSYVVLVNKESGIETLSEWAQRSDLTFACDPEFSCRPEYRLLSEHYSKRKHRLLDYSLSLLGLKSGTVGSCVACSTDSFISDERFHVLEDDKKIFPRYDAVPIVRGESLRRYPHLREIVDLLSHSISTDEMQRLNYEVDINGKNVYKLSLGWLESRGLIGAQNEPSNESLRDSRQMGVGSSSTHSSARRRPLSHRATTRDSV